MNSELNPEAPEFYPHLTSVTEGGYTTFNTSIKASNKYPSGEAFHLYNTFTDFNILSGQLRESVVVKSDDIINTELPATKLKLNDNHYNAEKISDANECMLDRINFNIDTICDEKEANQSIHNKQVSSRCKTPTITKVEMGASTCIGAKNVPRPQFYFKDPIDNSESLWVPKISDKPNNIKPLSLNILYNDEGEAVGYEHPYKFELQLYHPPSKFIDPDREPPSFPPPLETTKFTYIDTEAQVDALVKHLNDVEELAVDVEHHAYRSYQGITCLIQISTFDGDFIIDALAVRQHIHKLNLSFTDPKKVKVFHGAEMDVLWLQRDFGVYIVGLFDTHQAAKALKINGLSLKHLLMRYCQVDTDKRFQLADWRIRPLPDELMLYARMDTHYLLYIWRKMKAELLEANTGQPHLLLSVFEKSRQICCATYNKEVVDENSHMDLYVRSRKSFNTQQMAALKMLYKWRDSQARILDESTSYLMPNRMLLHLAEKLPRDVQGINSFSDRMPPFVKQNVMLIHRMLLSCRELPLEPQLFTMPQSIRDMISITHNSRISYDVHDLYYYPEDSDDLPVNLDQATECIENNNEFQPDVQVFKPTPDSDSSTRSTVVSKLNVDAKMFVPPHERYRQYRILAQAEEMKEYREKEAKVAALSKGNELIKAEVLVKLQGAKFEQKKVEQKKLNELEKGEAPKAEAKTQGIKHAELKEVDKKTVAEEKSKQKTAQRKRKISSDKREQKDPTTEPLTGEKPNNSGQQNKARNQPGPNAPITRYNYNNVNYTKMFKENEKPLTQPRMKFKKHN